MKKNLLFLCFLFTLLTSSIDARVRVRRVGPDYRTETEKQADKQEGMTYGIIIAIVIGGLVIWKKVNG